MRRSKTEHLSSFLHSAIKKTSNTPTSKSAERNLKVLENLSLNQSNSTSKIEGEHSKKPSASPISSLSSSWKKSLITIERESTSLTTSLQQIQKPKSESERHLYEAISTILGGRKDGIMVTCDNPATDDQKSQEENLEIPWLSSKIQITASERQKVKSRGKKEKWVFKDTQSRRFQRLITTCDEKLGTDATLTVLGKLGRENGMKEYESLIKICVKKARECGEEEDPLEHIHKAYRLFRSMREQGFEVKDKTYGPMLVYLIDMRMVDEFQFFSEVIQEGNPAIVPRLGYYEMLLWIRVNNEDKVQELCNSIVFDGDCDSDGGSDNNVLDLAENYLLALCETDRMKELLLLLEVVDITKLPSLDCLSCLFKSIGRLLLEDIAEKLILALKKSEVENVSNFICYYAISMPDFAVEDVISKFENLHEKLEVRPSSGSYQKLIMHCCRSLKVHAAFALVEQMCQLDLDLPVDTLYPLLHAVEESCELSLVHPIYSVIRRNNLKPNGEALRTLINLCVKIKDFESAYNMLGCLKEMDIKPTAGMYNAILAGYLREKNMNSGEMVLKQMKNANVQPDSKTFSYLIANSACEEDIIKYLEEMQSSKLQLTKHVYMSLINAYVKCGLFEKAKQVFLDKEIPVKSLNEIKSVLVSSFASCGQMSDALEVYTEIKQAGCRLQPKAVISLIEHLQSEEELSILFQLLDELKDSGYWFDGCERAVRYCIQHKHLSFAVDLLKQLKDQDEMFTYAVLDQVYAQIFEMGHKDLQIGLDLLQAAKEELKLCPSRTSLDFLLSGCVIAKDSLRAALVWEEYEKADLSYNVMSYIRMYQLHMACGDGASAKEALKNITDDDPHVRSIIRACNSAFSTKKPQKMKKKVKVVSSNGPKDLD